MSGEGERVYYVMALRHLLPLPLGFHYLRLPGADLMGADTRGDELAGLECWLVQLHRDPEAPSGVQDALSQVAGRFHRTSRRLRSRNESQRFFARRPGLLPRSSCP